MDDMFNLYEHRGVLVVEVLVQKFDFLVISECSRYLRSCLEKREYPSTVFDIGRVVIIDSSVFGFLLEIYKTVTKKGNKIAIVCRDRLVLNAMNLLTLPQIIPVFDTLEAAADHLAV
ncbi:MAG: STAS domain-containing protein [Chrysiogenales bacterium]|nr:MAG: STAS domain-containing protein [Chrysiogenales bacterium]